LPGAFAWITFENPAVRLARQQALDEMSGIAAPVSAESGRLDDLAALLAPLSEGEREVIEMLKVESGGDVIGRSSTGHVFNGGISEAESAQSEGPSVQVGAEIGRWLGLRPEKVKALIPVGAAAAIAAAFNSGCAVLPRRGGGRYERTDSGFSRACYLMGGLAPFARQ
jgi:voltage-gated chloride channel